MPSRPTRFLEFDPGEIYEASPEEVERLRLLREFERARTTRPDPYSPTGRSAEETIYAPPNLQFPEGHSFTTDAVSTYPRGRDPQYDPLEVGRRGISPTPPDPAPRPRRRAAVDEATDRPSIRDRMVAQLIKAAREAPRFHEAVMTGIPEDMEWPGHVVGTPGSEGSRPEIEKHLLPYCEGPGETPLSVCWPDREQSFRAYQYLGENPSGVWGAMQSGKRTWRHKLPEDVKTWDDMMTRKSLPSEFEGFRRALDEEGNPMGRPMVPSDWGGPADWGRRGPFEFTPEGVLKNYLF